MHQEEVWVAEAILWGAVTGCALLLGSAAGLLLRLPRWFIALAMAFGAGALVSAVSIELTLESYAAAGFTVLAPGLAAGALLFFVGDMLIDRAGGQDRKRSHGRQAAVGLAILLGAVLDGIPESVIVGAGVYGGDGVGVAFILAVFVSNLPEGLSGTVGLAAAGWRRRRIAVMWMVVLIVSAVASLVGYLVARAAPRELTAFLQALAAGAVLVMLADTMMPEAFDEGRHRPWVGLATALGFVLSAALSLAS